MLTPRSPWWDKGVHEDRRPLLLARGRIKDALRRYFLERDFVEAECGALQISPGNEAHLHAFGTEWQAPNGEKHAYYLHTSPEFSCKKLLAAGEKRIFTFAPVYRNRERGRLHAPAFTMLEWYRTGEDYEAVIADSLALLRIAVEAAGTKGLCHLGKAAATQSPAERIHVADAFHR